MSERVGVRALLAAAILSVVLHLLGSGLALGVLAPGSPAAPLDARLAYLAGHPPGWQVGWGVWMLCALALVAFLAALARYAAEDGGLAVLAVVLAGAGAGVDLLCDTVQIVLLPDLAGWRPPDPALFFAFERAAGAGGTVVANGLYSLAVLLVTLALRRRVPAHATALGLSTCAAGLLLAAVGFLGDPGRVPPAAGATIGAFLLWTADVTLCLLRAERA